MTKIKYVGVFCLLLCLLLVGCSQAEDENVDDPSIIYAPTEADDDDKAQDTDDGFETEPAGTDTTASVDTESEDEETTADTEPIRDPDAGEVTDDTDTSDDDPDMFIPEDTTGLVRLGDALLSGDPVAGRLVSQQSDRIHLVVNYNCRMGADGGVTIDFEVGLECYDLSCTAKTGTLTVDGVTHNFKTEPLSQQSREAHYMPFTTYSCQIDEGQTYCDVDASLTFYGVYSGTYIDLLTVEGVLDWDGAER